MSEQIPIVCSGIAATWCLIHGACSTGQGGECRDALCPLHGTASDHPRPTPPLAPPFLTGSITFGDLPSRVRELASRLPGADGAGHVWDNMNMSEQRSTLVSWLDVLLGGLEHQTAIISENAELLAASRAGKVSAVLLLARIASTIRNRSGMEHRAGCADEENCTCGAAFVRELYAIATSTEFATAPETEVDPLALLAECERDERALALDIESRLDEPHSSGRDLSADEIKSIRADALDSRQRERTFRALYAIVGQAWLYEFAADRLAGAVSFMIDQGLIDARSVAGDALLDYASTRHGDSNPIREVTERYETIVKKLRRGELRT